MTLFRVSNPLRPFVAAFLLAFGLAQAGSAIAANPTLEFNRDIRPILAENCFACHGPDSASRKADLRLDRRETAIEMGAIVPGKPSESELINRVLTSDADEIMPPPKTKKTLTAEQKERLKQWVESGAEYQLHWSLIPPKRIMPPTAQNESWIRNPIDRFVLARLEAKGLTPAPEADRPTLARRLSLDLTGLPPSPESVDAFVKDKSPDAYEKYVDSLLGSDRWGEHRARYWLDAARYADTHGIHFDNYREMWSYRDWVINAFNRNVPYDVFSIEQLAGDLLPNRSLDQQVASGFNRCNITTNEGGAISEEYSVLYTRDRTETVGQIWMGMTAGCAVCHDHKFDPISQKEFYALSAFFNNTTQNAMDGNVQDTPPTVFVPRAEDRARWERIEKDVAQAKTNAGARRTSARPDFEKWLASPAPASLASTVPADGLALLAPLSEGSGGATAIVTGGAWRQAEVGAKAAWVPGRVAAKAIQFKPGVDLSLPEAGDFDTNQAFSYGAWVQFPQGTRPGAILGRMDEASGYRGWDLWTENKRIAAHIIHKWEDDALKVVTKTEVTEGQWFHLFVTYNGSGKADGVKIYVNGRSQPLDVHVDKLKGSIKTSTPLKIAQRGSLTSRINNLAVQDVRIYARSLPDAEVERLARVPRVLWLTSQPQAKRTDAETTELFDHFLSGHDPEFQKLAATQTALEQELALLRSQGTIAHVMQEKPENAMAYVLYRGEYDKRRDPVQPNTPAFLPPIPKELPKNRVGLAKWLFLPDQPLHRVASRSTVSGKSCSGRESSARPAISESRASFPATRSYWTGWPLSSATRAGT